MSDLFESFKKAYKMAGLNGEPLREEFELYLSLAPLADWEDKNGSLAWVEEWEKSEGLVRTYASKNALDRA